MIICAMNGSGCTSHALLLARPHALTRTAATLAPFAQHGGICADERISMPAVLAGVARLPRSASSAGSDPATSITFPPTPRALEACRPTCVAAPVRVWMTAASNTCVPASSRIARHGVHHRCSSDRGAFVLEIGSCPRAFWHRDTKDNRVALISLIFF